MQLPKNNPVSVTWAGLIELNSGFDFCKIEAHNNNPHSVTHQVRVWMNNTTGDVPMLVAANNP